MLDRYEPALFEATWRQKWKEADLFKTREEPGRPKFYALDFFPYPSGAGLSVGHCRNYLPTDVLCRMKFMQGFNVLHPMGFDAFGLPAENEAIRTKSAPGPMVEKYGANYKRQFDLVGIGYDWSRSFFSSDPSYYKWTQWIFELLYERGLAYQKMGAVNWDPVDRTVLADEEVIGGRAERSGALVEKRDLPQWYFKITDYAQQLIDDLDTIDWPEGIKLQQRNWIGRSEGVQFKLKVRQPAARDIQDGDFEIKTKPLEFEVFTTRIDTIFGMTFCVLSPEHPLVDKLIKITSSEFADQIREYRAQAAFLSDIERVTEDREKTGCFTGCEAINPANGKSIPIWIGDYVLATYGTGAIMAVPGHDERDFEFAARYRLEILQVIAPMDGTEPVLPFVSKDGVVINSGEYSNLCVAEVQAKLSAWIEALGIGEKKVQYKLRDWLISRQRYWGCPIPVIHASSGEIQVVPKSELPVLLPEAESYQPSEDGSSPLSRIPEFVNVTDRDGKLGKRETDTMGGFACSSWYFLRFCDPHNDHAAFSLDAINRWMPVDACVGGAEHAVMHLLYARFWTKVLYDAGLVSVKEPFRTLHNQGQVLALTPYRKANENEKLEVGEEGILVSFEEASKLPPDDLEWRWSKMSKSKRNVVTPEEAVEKYGADALRVYELFVAPFDADVKWSNDGIQGSVRFLSRVFKFISELKPIYQPSWKDNIEELALTSNLKAIRRIVHKTILRCTENIEHFSFNTYISSLMELMNFTTAEFRSISTGLMSNEAMIVFSELTETLILLLAPAAPHSADELWQSIGKTGFTYHAEWPVSIPELAKDDKITISFQVNGKLRDTAEVDADASKEEILAVGISSLKVQKHLSGLIVKKEIVVPGKLVNFVAN